MLSEKCNDDKSKEGKIYSLISQDYKDTYKESIKLGCNETYCKLLLVTDFVSGMTDSYALDLYKKLSGF